MKRLEGQVVLVTGGSRGLGPAMCEELAGEGAHVVVGCRRREDEAREVAAAIEAAGGSAEVCAFDVREPSAVDAAVRGVIAARGKIDALVCSAGVHHDGFLAMAPLEAWDDVMATNLRGAMLCMRAVLRPMMGRRAGSIVAVSSVAGVRGAPGQTNYAASKGGLMALVHTLAREADGYGVRVNAVVPGVFTAGMATKAPAEARRSYLERVPLGRAGEPRELARAVVFLVSDDASYVTGQGLVVDGGLIA